MSVNKVILLGNVGNDPDIRESNGGKFATFRIATTDKGFTKRDGTQVPERTEWHSIVVNGGLVQVVERYVKKGARLYVEGRLRTRKYTDRNGAERTTTEVHLDNMEMLGGKPEPQQGATPPFYNQERSQQNPNNWGGDDNMPY